MLSEPKGPNRTKNAPGSKFTTYSEFTIANLSGTEATLQKG